MKMYDDFRLFVAPGAGSRSTPCGRSSAGRAFCRPACCRWSSVLVHRRRLLDAVAARRSGRDAGRRGRRLDDRERPVRPAEPQHVQQLRGRLDAAGVAARARTRARRRGPPARPRAGRRRGRDRDLVPADEGAGAARGGVGRHVVRRRWPARPAGGGCSRRRRGGGRRAAGARLDAVGAVARVVSRAARGQLPRSDQRVTPARRRLHRRRRRDGGDRDPPARSAADRAGRRAGGAGRQHAAQHGRAPRRGERVPAGRVRAAGAAAICGAPAGPGRRADAARSSPPRS